MRDTIIKGTGNSRSIMAPPDLKSRVSSLDDLLDLFISGFACDFGPLNPAGVQVMGTELNKANLLSDETAALYPGLPENPVPDDVLGVIIPLITTALSRAQIEAVKYVGALSPSVGGSSHPKLLTFSFHPKIVFISGDDTMYGYAILSGSSKSGWVSSTFVSNTGHELSILNCTWSVNKVSFYSTASNNPGILQQNAVGVNYTAIAIG